MLLMRPTVTVIGMILGTWYALSHRVWHLQTVMDSTFELVFIELSRSGLLMTPYQVLLQQTLMDRSMESQPGSRCPSGWSNT